MNIKPNVYLSGAISSYIESGDVQKACAWRAQAYIQLTKYGFQTFNPMHIDEQAWSLSNSGVLEMNRYYLMHCELMLVNLSDIETSIGSIWEMSVACENKIPIYAFGDCVYDDRAHLNAMITYRGTDLQDCLKRILLFYSA